MTTKWVIFGATACFLLMALGVTAWLHGGRFWAPIRGETEQVIITNQGAYRVQGYERFYNLAEDVAAVDVKLAGYPQALDRREATECRGLLARRADLVAEYNASALAEETVGQWRAANLPHRLEHENPRGCEVTR